MGMFDSTERPDTVEDALKLLSKYTNEEMFVEVGKVTSMPGHRVLILGSGAALTRLFALPSSAWIPISERPSKTYENVLLSLADGTVSTGYRTTSDTDPAHLFWTSYSMISGLLGLKPKVLAWQPLPAGYTPAPEGVTNAFTPEQLEIIQKMINQAGRNSH